MFAMLRQSERLNDAAALVFRFPPFPYRSGFVGESLVSPRGRYFFVPVKQKEREEKRWAEM